MCQTPKDKVAKRFTKYVTRADHPTLPRFDQNLKILALTSLPETRDAVFNVLYKRLNQVNGLIIRHGLKAASVFLFLVAVRHKETLEDLPRLRVAARDALKKLFVVKKIPSDVSNLTKQFLDHLLRVIDVNDESYGLCVSALLFENIVKNA
ncbi:MAG: hypothetical protein MHPSP_001899, partial [Paramarteilia canceri]